MMDLTLEPYQIKAKEFLLTHDQAYLCQGIGLGKCATSLSALQELFLDGAIRAALIVAPLRVAVLTWPNEVAKWRPFAWMKVERLRGQKPSGKAHIYTINYEQLQSLESLDFCDVVVFDEITRAKNPSSERIKHLRSLFQHQRRWGLTGTPRPNSLLEIFAQIRLLDDGKHLGKSFSTFRSTYCVPIDYNQYNWEPKPGADRFVYERIADMTLVLRTSDYLNLPEAVVEDVEIPLPQLAERIYKKLEKDLIVLVNSGQIAAVNAGVLVNKLLQVSSGQVYDDEKKVIEVHPSRLVSLKKLLKGMPEENCIIFTNYIHERERVCKAIGGTDASLFDGDIEGAWNRGEIKYLVADPSSLGHGLNLQQGGRTIIWYSLCYSREKYDQANGRVFRKGQTQAVRIYRLLCSGTIDEVVIETLRQKAQGQGEMLELLSNFKKLRVAA